jgi:hypothetical protein
VSNKIKVNISAATDGSGLWSRHKTNVTIKEIEVHRPFRRIDERDKFSGELRAFFSNKDWDIRKHGLIYTDRGWLKEFRNKLMENGFSKKAANSVTFSEQGMQGDDYVSMDAGSEFIKEFAIRSTFGEVEEY